MSSAKNNPSESTTPSRLPVYIHGQDRGIVRAPTPRQNQGYLNRYQDRKLLEERIKVAGTVAASPKTTADIQGASSPVQHKAPATSNVVRSVPKPTYGGSQSVYSSKNAEKKLVEFATPDKYSTRIPISTSSPKTIKPVSVIPKMQKPSTPTQPRTRPTFVGNATLKGATTGTGNKIPNQMTTYKDINRNRVQIQDSRDTNKTNKLQTTVEVTNASAITRQQRETKKENVEQAAVISSELREEHKTSTVEVLYVNQQHVPDEIEEDDGIGTEFTNSLNVRSTVPIHDFTKRKSENYDMDRRASELKEGSIVEDTSVIQLLKPRPLHTYMHTFTDTDEQVCNETLEPNVQMELDRNPVKRTGSESPFSDSQLLAMERIAKKNDRYLPCNRESVVSVASGGSEYCISTKDVFPMLNAGQSKSPYGEYLIPGYLEDLNIDALPAWTKWLETYNMEQGKFSHYASCGIAVFGVLFMAFTSWRGTHFRALRQFFDQLL